MVNIQSFSQIILSDAAILACIVVALAGFAALFFPIQPIVRWPPSFPVGMIFSRHIFRLPYSHTALITKEFLSFSNFTLNSLKRFITSFTLDSYRTSFPMWRFLANKIFAMPFSSAFLITKFNFRISIICIPFKTLSTLRTLYDAFLSALPTWRFFTTPIIGFPFTKTFTITEIMRIVFNLTWPSFKSVTTLRTFYINTFLQMLIDGYTILTLKIILTLATAKLVLGILYRRLFSFKLFPTIITHNLTCSIFPSWGILTSPMFALPISFASPITKMMLRTLYLIRLANKGFITKRTFNIHKSLFIGIFPVFIQYLNNLWIAWDNGIPVSFDIFRACLAKSGGSEIFIRVIRSPLVIHNYTQYLMNCPEVFNCD